MTIEVILDGLTLGIVVSILVYLIKFAKTFGALENQVETNRKEVEYLRKSYSRIWDKVTGGLNG